MYAVAEIAGVGLVTPLGSSLPETWAALLRGESIRNHSRCVGELGSGPTRVSQLGKLAALEAMQHAGWHDQRPDSNNTAVVVGTSKGAIESWMTAPPLTSDHRQPAGRLDYGLTTIANDIAQATRLTTSRQLTLSAACASGLHALIRAAMMIATGEVSHALVVAAEASVHPLFLGSFDRLGVLPAQGERCRPFDQNRTGFLMSEAAAAVCLERSGVPAGDIGRIQIADWAMLGQAGNLVAGDPTGRVTRRLLQTTLRNGPVDLIHAHGTGTVLNDAHELDALDAVLPATTPRPVLYSHKGALGHSLGAAGLVSVVLNTRMHRNDQVPGNVNTEIPIPSQSVMISHHPVDRPIRRSLVHSTGFGGPSAAVCLVSSRT